TAPSPCPFEEMIEKADIVSSFISLAVQQPVYVTDLRVRPHIHESVEPVVADPVDVVYYTPAPASPTRLLTPPHDMVFVLADVRGHLSTHLQCWERSWHSMLPILSLYFSRLYEQRVHLEHRFLSLIQAVEGYHRRRMSKPEVPEEEHAARIKDILAAVPERHKTWLEGQLRYSNEPKLDKRLSELCDRWDGIMRKVARNRRWVQEAVTIRNNLAHQKEDADHFSVDQVLTICERLKLLLDLCLLTEAGFAAAEIRRLVYRYWRRHPPFLAIDAKRMLW
ncbi:MAG: HEPN domain-containing protein, partial [Candidatus Bipolaricaulota bacterium]